MGLSIEELSKIENFDVKHQFFLNLDELSYKDNEKLSNFVIKYGPLDLVEVKIIEKGDNGPSNKKWFWIHESLKKESNCMKNLMLSYDE